MYISQKKLNNKDLQVVNHSLLVSSNFIEKKNYSLALSILEDLDEKFINIPEVIENFGLSYYYIADDNFTKKNYAIAKDFFEKAEYFFSKIKKKKVLFNIYLKLAICYKNDNDYISVLNYHKKLYKLEPESNFALPLLIYSKLRLAEWSNLDSLSDKAFKKLRNGIPSITPFTSVLLTDNPELQLLCAKNYSDCYINSKSNNFYSHERNKTHKKIKIAYLSSDFCDHATSHLIAGMFEKQNNIEFDYYAISYTKKTDNSIISKRVLNSFKNFHHVADKTDNEIEKLLYDLQIDIAIDLKGHTKDNRLSVLKNRPCPIQISYLGYPGSLGTNFIDYLIFDKYLVNKKNRSFFCENIIYMPHTYQCNDDKKEELTILKRDDFNLPDDKFILCSLNNTHKYNKNLFNVWVDILKKNENVVLWLLDGDGVKELITNFFLKSGINENKIIFAPRVDSQLHLSRLALADLCVDSFPSNAHTAASDALFVDLPIITLSGKSISSRVCGSLLNTLGLNQLICNNLDEYNKKINFYIKNKKQLENIKNIIMKNKYKKLFNAKLFAKNMEQSYKKIWKNFLDEKELKDLIIKS